MQKGLIKIHFLKNKIKKGRGYRLDITKKAAKKEFCFLAIGFILYEIVFQFVVLGSDMIELNVLFFLFQSMDWEQATQIIYQSGIGLTLATVTGCIVMGLVLRQPPDFKKKKKITFFKILLFYILMQGLQLLGNYILIPMDYIAYFLGYHFEEASHAANDTSVLFSAFVYSVLAAPIAEEILCRGIVMKYLEKYGKTFAVILSAILFGLIHQNIVQLPITIMIGVLFGYLAQQYSLAAAILLHVLNNVSIEIVGTIAEKWNVIWLLDALFLHFCAIASFVILLMKRECIITFWQQRKGSEEATKWFFTTPLMLLVIIFFLFSTILSATPF